MMRLPSTPRGQVFIPLELFFGAKLLVTGALISFLVQKSGTGDRAPIGPIIFVLGWLAALQLFIMVGLAYRSDVARQLGVGVCIAGGTIAVVLCLLAPFGWYLGVFIMALGLALLFLNGRIVIRRKEGDRGEFLCG